MMRLLPSGLAPEIIAIHGSNQISLDASGVAPVSQLLFPAAPVQVALCAKAAEKDVVAKRHPNKNVRSRRSEPGGSRKIARQPSGVAVKLA